MASTAQLRSLAVARRLRRLAAFHQLRRHRTDRPPMRSRNSQQHCQRVNATTRESAKRATVANPFWRSTRLGVGADAPAGLGGNQDGANQDGANEVARDSGPGAPASKRCLRQRMRWRPRRRSCRKAPNECDDHCYRHVQRSKPHIAVVFDDQSLRQASSPSVA